MYPCPYCNIKQCINAFLHVVVPVAQGKYFPALHSNYVHTPIKHTQSCFNWRSIKTLFTCSTPPRKHFFKVISWVCWKCMTAYRCSPGCADDQIALIQRCSLQTSVSQGMGPVGSCLGEVLNESCSGTDVLNYFSESSWSLNAYCQWAASAVSR